MFKSEGERDMVVLHSRALDAVRYFKNEDVRKGMEEVNLFGFPFSVIENGRLTDTDSPKYNANYIQRSLSFGRGVWNGVCLTYNDMKWGKETGGACCNLLDSIYDIKIENGRLKIKGYDRKHPVEYAYRIQRNAGEITNNTNAGALDRWLA